MQAQVVLARDSVSDDPAEDERAPGGNDHGGPAGQTERGTGAADGEYPLFDWLARRWALADGLAARVAWIPGALEGNPHTALQRLRPLDAFELQGAACGSPGAHPPPAPPRAAPRTPTAPPRPSTTPSGGATSPGAC